MSSIAVDLVSADFLGRLLQVDLIKPVSNVRPHVHSYVRPPTEVFSISMKFGM